MQQEPACQFHGCQHRQLRLDHARVSAELAIALARIKSLQEKQRQWEWRNAPLINPADYIGGPITMKPDILRPRRLGTMNQLFIGWVMISAILRIAVVVAMGVLAALLLIYTVHMARAAPPPNADPELAPWFESLTNAKKGGMHCCGANDCRPVIYRYGSAGYEIYPTAASYENLPTALLDHWYPVPADAVLQREDNPTGAAIACLRSMGGTVDVMCFIGVAEG